MSELYTGIMQGLTEALAYTRGELTENVTVHRVTVVSVPEFSPEEIREIRIRAEMTQSVFASCIGVTVKAIESWEGGRSHPTGTARRMLSLMRNNPRFADEMGIIAR